MAPRARSKFDAPMCEREVFRKQMHCNWRKYLWHCWDFSAPSAVILVPGELCPPFPRSLRPWMKYNRTNIRYIPWSLFYLTVTTFQAIFVLHFLSQDSLNYGPRAKCGPRHYFIRLQGHLVDNENIIYLPKICWFGGMWHIPKKSHYVRCPTFEMLCNYFCGRQAKKFGNSRFRQSLNLLRFEFVYNLLL